jgi:hypothetical protein
MRQAGLNPDADERAPTDGEVQMRELAEQAIARARGRKVGA